MSKIQRVLGLSAICVSVIGLAACGGKVIDDDKAEAAIKDSLESDGTLKVNSVDCPSDVDVEAGKIFKCEVTTSNGNKATAVLKIRNSDADVDFITLKPHK